MNNVDKMSELLGILDSIDYDEIINEIEIDELKKWLSINNNNSDLEFQNLIKKVNKIIEDKVVTQEEKIVLSNLVIKYAKCIKEKYSELIGIVEGIISDDIVNYKEASKLKIWLHDNSVLKGNYLYDRLVLLVNDVFADDELTEVEYKQLKIMLSFILKDNNLNQRINVLKKMVQSREFIGNELITLIDDNTIISKIHRDAIHQLEILLSRNCSVYAIDTEIIFLSLTLIALLSYDGNYYDYVAETYESLYEKYNEQKIEGQIRNIINKYRDEYDLDHRIISLILKNAIVPKKFLPSFFEFVFDIYRLNFDYGIEPKSDLFEEFSFVYDGIKKGLNFENDELSLNVTNKTYSLIKSTKDLINHEKGIESLIKLSVSILKIIDNYYWSNPSLSFDNEYFKYGFENWKSKLDKTVTESKNRNTDFRSRWEPSYKLVGNNVYITIPNHKIKDFYNYSDLKIQIFNNEELIYENTRPDVYDIIGGYRIENKDVLIEKPLGKIRYLLSCKNEVIYDSGEKLYRKYLVFSSIGDELKNNKDYDGLAIVCFDNDIESLTTMFVGDNYRLMYRTIKIGDYIKINQEIFNFSTLLLPGVIGRDNNVIVELDEVENVIYSEVLGLIYESINDANRIAIIINGERYKLVELEYEIKKRGIYNNFFIKLALVSGKYVIGVEELEEGRFNLKKEFNFVLDSGFDYQIEQTTNQEYMLKINYLSKKYTSIIIYDSEDINKIVIKENKLVFYLPLDIQVYKVDNNSWKELSDLSNYIWLKDLTTYSSLKINGVDFDTAKVVNRSGEVLTELYPIMRERYNTLSIGTLKSYESQEFIHIDFYKSSKKIGVLKVYCKTFINSHATNIWYDKDDDSYHGLVSYYGSGNVYVNVLDELENVVFEQKVLSGDKVDIASLDSFKEYKFVVIDKALGFSFNSDRILCEKKLKHYSLKDFVGRYFLIYSVDYNQTIHGIWQRRMARVHNTFVEITNQTSDFTFDGNLYIYRGEKKYLDKLNPVEIEFISDVDANGEIQALITKDEDGLFNDFANKTILNELESRTAVDIYSYVIKVERR